MSEHSDEKAVTGCASETCRAWAIRIGEDPNTITCYLCRAATSSPAEPHRHAMGEPCFEGCAGWSTPAPGGRGYAPGGGVQ